jgi:hypothetical protein
MIKISAERDKHIAGVINHRSNAKADDQCHNIFERSARLRKLSQEFEAGPLRRWPNPAESLADYLSNDALRCQKITKKELFIM